MLNTLANGKIQGLFKAIECFSSTFQGKFYFQDDDDDELEFNNASTLLGH